MPKELRLGNSWVGSETHGRLGNFMGTSRILTGNTVCCLEATGGGAKPAQKLLISKIIAAAARS
jgi:hypothetical protein